jgi:hypothetical protein
MSNDLTCPNCGAANRPTSRFCARCGEVLPKPNAAQEPSGGTLDLPWLQSVQDKAVKGTESLDTYEGQVTPTPPAPAAPTPTQRQPEPARSSEATEPLPEGQEPPQAGPPDEPPPPWVVSILEPAAAATGPEQTYEPEELSHIMPWAHGKPEGDAGDVAGTEEFPAPPATADASTPGLPPWLGDVTVQETLEGMPTTEQRVPAPEELQLEGVEPFEPPSEEAALPESPPDEVPDWLRSISGTKQPDKEPDLQRASLTPSLAIEPTETLDSTPVRNIPVRPPRAGAVETLAVLLQPAAPEVTRRVVPDMVAQPGVRSEPTGRRGMRGWLLPDGIIYLIILASLLAVLIIEPPFGEITPPASPGIIEFYNAVEAVPADRPVLVVYDWDASRSAEMSVLSQAVMHHIMMRKLPFITVSTVPQGPGFAQQTIDDLVNNSQNNYGYQYGSQYLILGYLPGNEAALRSLSDNFRRVLPLDYVRSQPLGSYSITQGDSLNKIDDFALIIDLASGEAEMRNWIEQVAARTDVPIIAAVPHGMEPVTRPYLKVPGAGLQAVASGTAGAAQYIRQLNLGGRGAGPTVQVLDLNTRLNAQSVAQVLVALVIVAAFLALGVRRILRR